MRLLLVRWTLPIGLGTVLLLAILCFPLVVSSWPKLPRNLTSQALMIRLRIALSSARHGGPPSILGLGLYPNLEAELIRTTPPASLALKVAMSFIRNSYWASS